MYYKDFNQYFYWSTLVTKLMEINQTIHTSIAAGSVEQLRKPANFLAG